MLHVALVVREFNELTNTSTEECILEGQDVKHNICVLCERGRNSNLTSKMYTRLIPSIQLVTCKIVRKAVYTVQSTLGARPLLERSLVISRLMCRFNVYTLPLQHMDSRQKNACRAKCGTNPY